MDILFIDAPYSGTVELCPETLTYLKKKKYTSVGLYASVQFVHNLEGVKKQLQEAGIDVVTSRPDRTHIPGQLLGCDNYHNSLQLTLQQDTKINCYLYIGDGKFHPLALVYGQKDLFLKQVKEIICNDPIHQKMSLLSFDDIKNILQRYKGALMKFLTAERVGVIVTIKPGQEQLKPAFMMGEKFPDKKFYYFIDNVVSFEQLENFPFIQVWVNTTCPRVGFDDQEKFAKGVINLNDALMAEEILGKESALTRG